MFNKIELEVEMMRKGFKKKDVAQLLGITKQGLHNKISGKSEFKASELEVLSQALGIREVSEIFFTKSVELKSPINSEAKRERR